MATGWFFSAERQAPREQAFANLLLACIRKSDNPTSLLPDLCLQACGICKSGLAACMLTQQFRTCKDTQAHGLRAQQGT